MAMPKPQSLVDAKTPIPDPPIGLTYMKSAYALQGVVCYMTMKDQNTYYLTLVQNHWIRQGMEKGEQRPEQNIDDMMAVFNGTGGAIGLPRVPDGLTKNEASDVLKVVIGFLMLKNFMPYELMRILHAWRKE